MMYKHCRTSYQHDNNEKIQSRLHQSGTNCDIRQLSLGDVLWVARKVRGDQGVGEEVMLRYVLERKTAEDLAKSIIDGR